MSTAGRTPCVRRPVTGLKKSLGPRLEKSAGSVYGLSVVSAARAATAMPLYDDAGAPTVLDAGPEFPAAATNVVPLEITSASITRASKAAPVGSSKPQLLLT